MTPLEAMARAHWEKTQMAFGSHSWEESPDEDRVRCMDEMRAVLLALAEAELPEEALKCSLGTSKHTKQAMFESRMDLRPMIFRAVCRAIAGGEK